MYGDDPNNYMTISHNIPTELRWWPTHSMAPKDNDVWVSGGLGIKFNKDVVIHGRNVTSLYAHTAITMLRYAICGSLGSIETP